MSIELKTKEERGSDKRVEYTVCDIVSCKKRAITNFDYLGQTYYACEKHKDEAFDLMDLEIIIQTLRDYDT